MSWTYHQTTGLLEENGYPVTTGYSGHGVGLNQPDMEDVENIGPIPRGHYNFGRIEHQHHCQNGKILKDAMSLSPVGHNAHHRTHLFIHGANDYVQRNASTGCIVVRPEYRLRVAHSGDHDLEVVR